ncbi:hypothetical protein [Gluconacetobacter entanii]|uniref:hypothetical protein n=1 Tax=Gluconacetobacter entanii TaxID=108528 RepID=UPI0011B4C51D|nr:hypothetical protein [Gluconacetobacter entanii]
MKFLLSLFFYWPGRLLIEIQYLFPAVGKVMVSGRRRESKFAAFVFSLGFWATLGFVSLVVIQDHEDKHASQNHHISHIGNGHA